MLAYKYTYFVGCLVFTLMWLIIYIIRPRLRMEMIIMGVLGLVIGPVINKLFFLKDWWEPLYITSTKGGIEDLILGFTNISLASVVYKAVFNRYSALTLPLSAIKIRAAMIRSFIFACITLIPILLSFYILHLHSFWSVNIGLLMGGAYVVFKRLDLIIGLVWSSLLLPSVAIPAFLIAEHFSPGWIETYWYSHNLSNITLWKVPIEDLIWYMFSGLCFGGLFNYVFNLQTDFKKSTEGNAHHKL